MGKRTVIALLLLAASACNLTTEAPATPTPEVTALPETAITPAPTTPGIIVQTVPPPPLLMTVRPSPSALAASTGQFCLVYTTYSGSDPANKLSLRAQPNPGAAQLLKLPNETQVFLVPGSQEVEADGYHWLNIIYVDGMGNRYEGWTARDSYVRGSLRDPSVATLRPTGQQGPC